jgi:hypothetical protein
LNRKLFIVSAFIVCTAGIFAFVSSSVHLPGLYRLARRPSLTQGSITAKLPAQKRYHVNYAFVVSGKTYNAEGAVGDAYETIAIGATVPVIYDPTNPEVSCIYDPAHPEQRHVASPEESFFSMAILISVFSIIGGLMFTFSIWQLAKRHRLFHQDATRQIVGRERR